MKVLVLTLFLSLALASHSQSLVYGLYTDANAPYSGYSILATIEPSNGVVLEKDTIYDYEGVVLGSSSFDQLSANYVYLASGNNGFDLLTRNVFSNTTVSVTPATMTANALQFDMATGLTYGLGIEIVDSVLIDPMLGWYDYIYGTTFLAIDTEVGSTEVIAQLPDVDAVVLGASCFDPNSSIYYFIGISSDYESTLFGVDAQTGELSTDLNLNLGPNEYLNELEYDIQGNVFYALHRTGLETMHFAQIDPQTGQIFDLLDISSNVQYFTPDASVYHQETGQFIMLTVNPNSILTINADDAEILSQAPIDYSIIEMEVDNVEFANAQFVSVSELEISSVSVFPNPAHASIILDDSSFLQADYRFFDMTGQLVLTGTLREEQRISIDALHEGVYLLEIQNGSRVSSVRIVVQR